MTAENRTPSRLHILFSDDGQHIRKWSSTETFDGSISYARSGCQTSAAAGVEDKPDALIAGLAERIQSVVDFQGYGHWQTCSGCYESEDGYPNGDYSQSKILGCTLGAGCSECGGIGAVWDDVDYEAMAQEMREDDATPPVKEVSRVAGEVVRRMYHCTPLPKPQPAPGEKA